MSRVRPVGEKPRRSLSRYLPPYLRRCFSFRRDDVLYTPRRRRHSWAKSEGREGGGKARDRVDIGRRRRRARARVCRQVRRRRRRRRHTLSHSLSLLFSLTLCLSVSQSVVAAARTIELFQYNKRLRRLEGMTGRTNMAPVLHW